MTVLAKPSNSTLLRINEPPNVVPPRPEPKSLPPVPIVVSDLDHGNLASDGLILQFAVVAVVDNADPESLGRIQVVIPALVGETDDVTGKWIPIMGRMQYGAATNVSGQWIPEIGSMVLIIYYLNKSYALTHLPIPLVIGEIIQSPFLPTVGPIFGDN